MSSLQMQQRESRARCPLCREPLDEAEAEHCADCGTGLHVACARELGGCPTLGCSARVQAPREAPEARPRAGAALRNREEAGEERPRAVATPRQREEPPARGRSSERIKGHVFGAGFLALYGAFMLFGALNKGRPLLALVALPLLLLAAVSLYTRHPPRARTGPLWVERVVWLTCTGLRVLISGCLGVFAATLVVVALSAVIGALRGETALLGGAASGFVFALGLGWLTLLVWGFGGWPRLDDWPS